ncbi:MAG: hypothetical protein ACI8P0_001148, partial [Planctomycetaceae bacterium]
MNLVGSAHPTVAVDRDLNRQVSGSLLLLLASIC